MSDHLVQISHIRLNVAMEDAHVTVLNLDESPTDKNTFFAVYDGHGGNSLLFFSGSF